MSRSSSTYVSPNLGPTGMFRPAYHDLSKVPAEEARNFNRSTQGTSVEDSSGTSQTASDGQPPEYVPAKKSDTTTAKLHATATPFYPGQHGIQASGASVAQNGGGSNSSSLGPSAPLPALQFNTIEKLMKLISSQVHTESDMLVAYKESSRMMEEDLQREQEQHRFTQNNLEAVEATLSQLMQLFSEQDDLLKE